MAPDKILSGTTIFGVLGSVVRAYMPALVGTLETSVVRSTCQSHRMAGHTTSGRYVIDVDGESGVTPASEAQCDMTTDGGGWTLVLNYLHKASTEPPLNSLVARFPLVGSTTLGTDESFSTVTWGHAVPGLLSTVPFSTARFFCRNSVGGIAHFKGSDSGCLSYLRTGRGSCNNFSTGAIDFSDANDLFAGMTQNNYSSNKDENALTNVTFAIDLANSWSLVPGAGPFGKSFNCMDIDGDQRDTHHQVWVR